MTVEILKAFSDLSANQRAQVIAYLRGVEDAKKLDEAKRENDVEARLREYELNGGDIDTTGFTLADFQRLGEIDARLANR